MRVRPYAAADLDALILLFRDSVRSVARHHYTPEQILAWAPDDIDRDGWSLRLGAGSTWVAAESTGVTGFISLEPGGHVDMLYVHAEFQRRGVATALLARLEQSARGRGLATLSTDASLGARAFFEARGFHVIACQTVMRRGEELRNFRMARPVCL